MATQRTQLVRKVYIYADGEEGRSAKPEATGLRFEFLAPEKDENDNLVVLETRTIDLEAFATEHPDMMHCAFGHGLSQKLGDNLAGIVGKAAKQEPPVEADPERGFVDFGLELFDDAWDNILADVWVAEGEGSSGAQNVTILFTAIVNVLTKHGKAFEEQEIRTKLRDADYRTKAKANPEVAAEVRKIELERAQDRLRKAEAKAAAADDSVEGLDDLV